MKLRWKLLLLMLGVSVVPILFLRLSGKNALEELQTDLSNRALHSLSKHTERELRLLARDHAEILAAKGRIIELSVMSLSEAVRQRLQGPPAEPAPYTVSRHRGMDPNTSQDDNAEQALSFRLPMMRAPSDAAETMRRLSGMAPFLQKLAEESGGLAARAVIILPDGLLADWPALDRAPGMGRFIREPWYRRMLETRELTWSPPMADPADGTPIRTALQPLYDNDGKLLAVAGLSVAMDRMILDDRGEIMGLGLKAYLVRPEGETVTVLASNERTENAGGMHRWQLQAEPQLLSSSDAGGFRQLRHDLQQGENGLLTMPHDGELAVWSYAPTRRDLSLVFVVPLREAEQEALRARDFVQERITQLGHRTQVVLVLVLLTVSVVTFWLSSRMGRMVAELATALNRVARGDFSARAPVHGRDELGDLARSFNSMVPALEDQVRMKESLGLASEVQMNLLPGSPPAIGGLDVDGGSLYCDETGGDLYDFFPCRQGALGVAVGDVTGHGISAALLMSSARAYLRAHALTAETPGGLLTDVNRLLCDDTFGTGRFLTLGLLVFTPETRSIVHARAGHDPALLYDPASDTFEELGGEGLPLGVLPEEQYQASLRQGFAAGQIVVLGTDGIWETANPQTGELFGKERMKDIVRTHAGESASAIREAVLEVLTEFRGEASFLDDVTLVVVKAGD